MNQTLYHASFELFELDATLAGKTRVIHSDKHWIEDAFEEARKERFCSRRAAVFASANPEDAYAYLRGESAERKIYVYEVEMPSPHRHPMVLIDRAAVNGPKHTSISDIANEYWTPTKTWTYWEYFDTSLTILRLTAEPDDEAYGIAKGRHLIDFDLARRLWPPPKR